MVVVMMVVVVAEPMPTDAFSRAAAETVRIEAGACVITSYLPNGIPLVNNFRCA